MKTNACLDHDASASVLQPRTVWGKTRWHSELHKADVSTGILLTALSHGSFKLRIFLLETH